MALPLFIRANPAGALLAIKLQPRSSKNEIGGTLGHELKVKITSAPVDGKANQAVLDFLSAELGCRRNALELVRGHTSRHKLILLRGLSAEEAAAKLCRLSEASS